MDTVKQDKPAAPHRVVTRDGRTHVQHPLGRVRRRPDCNECSLDNDFEGCIDAKCHESVYKREVFKL